MLAFAGGGSLLESQETILSTFHPNVRAFLLCNRGGDAKHNIKAKALPPFLPHLRGDRGGHTMSPIITITRRYFQ
jgi:hypothetical protein